MEILESLTKRQIHALGIIAEETGDSGSASLKTISMRMQIKPPSALEILRPLVKFGLISRKSGKSRLTEEGVKALQEYRRRHRIVETLLAGYIGKKNSHEAAAEIDMSVSRETADRVCAAMGHPDTCPHGEGIDPCGGEGDN